ncbi:MAG: glycosyltransferase family 2 protein [Ruminococcus sp.]|jgi:glycosyltransferase involved in cell wall biosynthesis|nr:glycosyltransferase family 2 protein [Ruminococcus sp.]
MDKLWLVVPCYNEEEVLPETSKRLYKIMADMIINKKIAPESKIAFVNDGSKDNTWKLIEKYHANIDMFVGINLSRNRGHQNALLAGLSVAKQYADMVISLDADLQDDINAIPKFVDKYYEGNDIVYGVRNNRDTDTGFKRNTAQGFYKFMKFLGVDIVDNHADYRLMSKRALEGLFEFGEVNVFLRGIVPQIGYPSAVVEYKRNERLAGESKYPLKKMLAFAFDGITSFSVKPLRISLVLGIIAFIVAMIILIYCIVQFILGNTVSGWASLSISLWGLGGMQLLMLGIVGEYIGKIYLESKHRPKFIIKDVLYKEF